MKIPWRRAWQPTLVFLPGKFRGQRNLAGYSPQGGRESDTTKVTEYVCMHAELVYIVLVFATEQNESVIYVCTHECMCRGPAPADPGYSKGRRRRRPIQMLIRAIKSNRMRIAQ